jgi:hypothetical protein
MLPSAMLNGVGTPVAIISQLNTLPACAPVNASMAASRLATHDSGPGWIATPFLYDSFIHNSTPVVPKTLTRPVPRLIQDLAGSALPIQDDEDTADDDARDGASAAAWAHLLHP